MAKKIKPGVVQKYQPLPPELESKQKDARIGFGVGDMFFTDRDGGLIRIESFSQYETWANDDHHDRTKVLKWQVDYTRAEDWEATEWGDVSHKPYDDFIKLIQEGEYVRLTRPLKDIEEEAARVISGEISTEVYYQDEHSSSINEENAIIGRNSKSTLLAIQESMELKRDAAALIHKAVQYEMERKRQELESVREKMYGAVALFKKQVEKIMRVITTIELYLGIEEELHQIREGAKAPATTPISFRQMVLYMDEEVGVHEEQGMDFRNIEMFDEWLVTGNNIDIVLPEKKGIVVLNPRRRDKDYKDDYLNVIFNMRNKYDTYILIRNGDCIYRIYTEKLVIRKRLFPLRKEMGELAKKMQQSSWDKEKAEDELYQYKNQAMLLQGLVDRTEVFHPLPVEHLNIFKLHEAGKFIKFIYDGEPSLTTGKPLFRDWKNEINNQIKEGTRVLLTGWYGDSRRGYSDRFYLKESSSDYQDTPDLPPAGVYEVESFTSNYISKCRTSDLDIRKQQFEKNKTPYKYLGVHKSRTYVHRDEKTGDNQIHLFRVFDEEPRLTIMFKPKKEATKGWNRWDTHERKNRTRFKIYPDDSFVINYDQLDFDDVDYYLKSRIDRENYLYMMPTLKELRKHMREERRMEQEFVDFIVRRNEDDMLESEIRKRTAEAIRWWKFKNKWKRGITKDDALALRMIEQRVFSPQYKTFKLH